MKEVDLSHYQNAIRVAEFALETAGCEKGANILLAKAQGILGDLYQLKLVTEWQRRQNSTPAEKA